MLKYQKFSPEWVGKVHRAFIKSFSDYLLSFQPSFSDFEDRVYHKLKLRQDLSWICVSDDQVVGFMLHAFNRYRGYETVYNGGMGVIPSHRKQGIALTLYEKSFPSIMSSGAKKVVLEVITHNQKAINLYEKLGFTFSRVLKCYKSGELDFTGSPMGLRMIRVNEWSPEKYHTFADFEPSFLDSDQQIPFHFDRELLIEAHWKSDLVGYLLFNPKSGRISQWATKPEIRGRGVGRSLLQAASAYLDKNEFTLLNVPETAEETHMALKKMGFKNQVDQYEMELKI